ncbi:MAG: hypothetical protein RLZZ505_337 [Verrucomicrobiota bacterium]|jgi:hypothetical protein
MEIASIGSFLYRGLTRHRLALKAKSFIFPPMLPYLPALFFTFSAAACAQSLVTPRICCEIENTVKTTLLTATAQGADTPIRFRIDWLSGNETPENFRNHTAMPDRLTSTHRLGKNILTRTILVSESADCILVHIHADQPGAVHFTACFDSQNPVKIQDRRQIVLSGKQIHAHAWIIPFESDVSDDGKTITLSGEGEALVILNLTPDPVKTPILSTLSRLGEKYDPSHNPPNPHLIWQGVLKTRDGETQDTRKD